MNDLWPYQREAVDTIRRMDERCIVCVGPTGSGKTVVAAELVRQARARRVLWLAHRVELLRQARDEIVAAGVPSRDVGILSGTLKENTGARILVCSVAMLVSKTPPSADFIVVDEAHRIAANTYQRILSRVPSVPVLGLTATPERLDGKPLDTTFGAMHVFATPTQLIADGYIAQPVTYGVSRERARYMVSDVGRSGHDYSQRQLGESMNNRILMGDTLSEWKRLASDRRTVVFASSRSHAAALCDKFREAEPRTEYLDGTTPAATREAMLHRLRSGDTRVIVNVDCLSEGFDCPPVGCIVLARPTKSLTRYLQQIGRGSRPYRGERPIILDHAGNTWCHGLPEAERSWSLEGREKSPGDAPVRRCPECAAMIPISAQECTECGAEARTEEEVQEMEVELERVRATQQEVESAESRVRELARRRGASEAWVGLVMRGMFGDDRTAA